MLCMADWYLRGGDPNDQTRLSRILDVAQDLKALSMLLNISQFTFVVDLACLASRREYLKLDKWLTDKIREHGVRLSEVFCMSYDLTFYTVSSYLLHQWVVRSPNSIKLSPCSQRQITTQKQNHGFNASDIS